MKNLGEDNISLSFRAASIHSPFFALSLNRYIRLRACISVYICMYVCMWDGRGKKPSEGASQWAIWGGGAVGDFLVCT